MFVKLQEEIRSFFRSTLQRLYGRAPEPLVVEVAARREFGDLALPAAFSLARELRRPPRDIAAEIVKSAGPHPLIEKIEIAGGGYINITLARAEAIRRLYEEVTKKSLAPTGERIIVEHTNINPNKAAHIGHLRNAVLGDSLVRTLRWLGADVQAQNYIDDTGVQVADVVVGFVHLEKMTLEDVARIDEPFDFYCWDLYAHVGRWYDEDASRLALREKALAQIEHGEGPVAELGRHVAERIVRRHLATMERMGIGYDLLVWESHILAVRFWQQAFEELKRREAVRLETEGRNAGCWVMSLEGSEDFKDVADTDKIIVRSSGTVTYVGKDIAYQMWKFGLMGRDFSYARLLDYPDGRTLWTSAPADGEAEHPPFGAADTVYNVIDVRQSYLQRIVPHALALMGHEEKARRSIHFSYEVVALSEACAEALGVAGEGEGVREMSGRKGVGVKADDLLDTLARRAEGIVREEEKNRRLEEREIARISKLVSQSALRYFMLRYRRNQVIAFDFDEALNFKGETGPYLLYSYVRFHSIFRNLEEREGFDEAAIPDVISRVVADAETLERLTLEEWDLLLEVARIDQVLENTVAELELSMLAKYSFGLAQRANQFYHASKILGEPDPKQKDPNQAPPNFAVLAAYRLSEAGAARVWKLDGAKYPVECKLDGGPGRRIYTRRDGVIYHGAWWGQQSKLAIVREEDGKLLASLDDCKHFWCVHLWGDRFFFLTDIQHGHHSTWQVYDLNPERPKKLDEATFPGYGDHRVCGYEVPLYEIFADGFMFCREVKTGQRWGGIVCYDLRKR